MTLGTWAIIIGGCAYAVAGVEQLLNGHKWAGVMWIGYSLCNVALIKQGATG